jgi:hypothetical protein
MKQHQVAEPAQASMPEIVDEPEYLHRVRPDQVPSREEAQAEVENPFKLHRFGGLSGS